MPARRSRGYRGDRRRSGTRVLGVTARAPRLDEAIHRAYEAVRLISFEDMYYRKDIGARALKAQK